ncbi:hypothetical protein J437_LFUL016730 [Ladona fulva]|uniref:Uncharacterized protein n=1 Tax=Ladona fulva TaxID=123851 RepID=A0A8K0KLW4_LADFU|nr:hypothetical protein J437_LFUL016730 [Ladona fulva]
MENQGNFMLRRRNAYYFQVQGQLEICNNNFCNFLVWSPGIIIQRIERDREFWRKNLMGLLEVFILNFLLPEICRGCYERIYAFGRISATSAIDAYLRSGPAVPSAL